MTLYEAISTRVKTIKTTPELRKRVIYTLLCFLVARIGIHITVPGINLVVLEQLTQTSTLAQFINLFSGGALQRASIFALGITPYINASIVFQILGVVIPKIDEMQKEGGKQRERITQWTRYLTIAITMLQSGAAAVVMQSQGFAIQPGFKFVLTAVTLVTGGTAFLMWLSEKITIKGIGNGTSMLIFLGIVANLPTVALSLKSYLANSNVKHLLLLLSILLFITIIILVTIVQLAERRVPIQYVGKTVMRGGASNSSVGRKTYIPIKINTAGVMPIIFASMLMALPTLIIQVTSNAERKAYLSKLLSPISPLYLGIFVLLIVAFSFFYTSIVFDATRIADNLKQSGGTIPFVRAGSETTHYLENIVYRITFGSAVFLAFLGILPNIWFGYVVHTPVLLGGTSLIILVGVAVDVLQQIDSFKATKSYKKFGTRNQYFK